MEILFEAVREREPGHQWQSVFQRLWPAYKAWYVRRGIEERPTYVECRKQLRHHMPELAMTYEALCELAGGGDIAARFLSLYCPPPYLSGCSQAVWTGRKPFLIRNYDYSPAAFDAIALETAWTGRTVLGMSDCLIGLTDGINDAGLAVSLTFGGRQAYGEGFGVPIILRYVLETCETVKEATAALMRIPSHMSYNVTVLDADGQFATVYLAPDRKPVLTHASVATNHQKRVEWDSHARATKSVERERLLLHKLSLHRPSRAEFISAFLRPPLYSLAFDQGFGTLFTALYQPSERALELYWSGARRHLVMGRFEEEAWRVDYPAEKPATAGVL